MLVPVPMHGQDPRVSVPLGIESISQYIILKDGLLRFYSVNITSKQGVYFTVHSLGVHRLIVNKTYEGNIRFMTVKIIYCPYEDSTWDIQSNIPNCFQEFP